MICVCSPPPPPLPLFSPLLLRSQAGLLVLQSGVQIDFLHRLEEISLRLLLRDVVLGEERARPAGLLHVAGQLVLDLVPLLLLDVSGEAVEADLGFGEDGLLAGDVLDAVVGAFLVPLGVGAGLGVGGVGGVGFAATRLVGTVCGSLGETVGREGVRMN